MKKLFTLFAFIAVTMCAMATDYTDNLVVNVGGAPLSSEQATISVTENEGKYTLTLKNFSITGLGGIGTIEVSDIEGTTSNGVTTLSYDGNVTIQAGDDESVTSWMMAGQSVPLTIDAELYSDEKMYAEIGINYMNVLQVDVVFGTKQETSASTDYTDNLVVNVGGAPFSNEEATISVTEANGVYTLALKNFSITGLGGIGTIEISGIEGTTDDAGNIVLAYSGDVTIQAGDDESVSSWMMAGQSVPVTLNAEIYSSEKMYAEIGINYMNMLQVDVVFGTKQASYTYTDYTDALNITVAGAPLPSEQATITVGESDGIYSLSLKNLSITGLGGIGTISIEGLEGTKDEDTGIVTLSYSGDVTIQAGDDESITSWLMAGQSVPVTIYSEIYSSEKMYAEIGINYMGMLQVDVVFGSKETTGINTVNASGNSDVEAIYDINGNKLNDMQKGINIIRKADGTTIKVLKK